MEIYLIFTIRVMIYVTLVIIYVKISKTNTP